MKVFLLAVVIVGLTSVAQAREGRGFSVHFSSFNAYYSCSAAERLTLEHLQAVGAQDIKVICSGGLPDWWYLDVFASYTVASPGDVGASYQKVTIQTDASCDLNEKILNEVFNSVYVKSMTAKGNCSDAKGPLSYSADLLK